MLRRLLIAAIILTNLHIAAQQVKTESGKKAPVRIFQPNVFVGSPERSGGLIRKSDVWPMLHKPLISSDSLNRPYKVISFDFTYVERNLYEDSVGNLQILPEYMTEHCYGDSLKADVTDGLKERIKSGDTLYYFNVQEVRYKPKTNIPLPDSTSFLAKSIRFIITK